VTAAPDYTLIALMQEATERMIASVEMLDDMSIHEPSILPGWSRAQVVMHLARNADGMRNLLLWARSGHTVRMYPSADLRNADIAVATTRSHAQLLEDLRASAERFQIDITTTPDHAWSTSIMVGPADVQTPLRRASDIAALRLTEVEIHHTDLIAAYGFANTPDDTATAILRANANRVTTSDPLGFTVDAGIDSWAIDSREHGDRSDRVVSAAPGAMLGWLTGRTAGTGCTTNDGAVLPALSNF
jgi:maleylpyruvate isomerase